MATASDRDLQIATAPPSGVEERNVEVVLIGGKVMHGFVSAALKDLRDTAPIDEGHSASEYSS
jgi:hypothetical protein